MSMWIISRGVVLLILLMEYKVLRDFLLHRSSINNSARLSNKFRGFYFSFKFDISGFYSSPSDHDNSLSVILRFVLYDKTFLSYERTDNDASESSQPSWIIGERKRRSGRGAEGRAAREGGKRRGMVEGGGGEGR
ncbi:hypothetical protein Tco_1100060 [Tanacetum coccineum]